MRGAQLKGWSRQNLLLEAGMPADLDFSSAPRFSVHQMTRLTTAIWRVLDDEFMGFTRNTCKTGSFAFAVHAMRKAHNLEDALITGFQFYSLVTDDIRTELVYEDDDAIIDILFTDPELDIDHYFEEFWMVIWHRLASWLTGIRIPLSRVWFSQEDPGYKGELGYMFPGVHTFGTTNSQLCFDRGYLALPIIRSKKEVDHFLARSPYHLMSIPGSDGTLRGSITSMLTPEANQPLHFPSIEEVAEKIQIPVGTLRRRLSEESSSYTLIKTELRRNMAFKLLAADEQSINQVAASVGFTESSSFVRAFKEWSGMTPLQYRRRLSRHTQPS